jgi:hypothetical protein
MQYSVLVGETSPHVPGHKPDHFILRKLELLDGWQSAGFEQIEEDIWNLPQLNAPSGRACR